MKTKPPTPRVKPRVTFESDTDANALAMAYLGQSDKSIQASCKLSTGQISYRLRKAKDVMEQEVGFRTQWRNGTSKLFKQIKDDIIAVLREDIQRTLPEQIAKPDARTVPE